MIDPHAPTTQAAFGDLVGISQPAVSGLVEREILAPGGTLKDWVRAYTEHLRVQAAGRAAMGSLDLATERARLASEQADRVAMQNAEKRKELAPSHALEEILTRAGSRAGKILDTIPGLLKRRLPQLSADDIKAVELVIVKARNLAADLTIEDLEKDDDARDDAAVVDESEARDL